MKKTYILPKSILVELDNESLIADSIGFGDDTEMQEMEVKEEKDFRSGKNLWDNLW